MVPPAHVRFRSPPAYVRFKPTDQELLEEFLKPRVNNQYITGCLVENFDIYSAEPDDFEHRPQPYFPRHQYWYFVNRERLHQGSTRPKRVINHPNNGGKWRFRGTKGITKGTQMLGHKETIDFETSVGVKTGWRQYEYCLADKDKNKFQDVVLVHFLYEADKDQRKKQAGKDSLRRTLHKN